MARRKVYLEDTPLDEARSRFERALVRAGAARPPEPETIPLADALGRVTAAPVWAVISSPHYHGAAMDGFAVRAEETYGATETQPLRLKVPEQAVPVDTGDALPLGRNAVIMIEDVQETAAGEIEIMAAAAPWHHVRPMGEDIVATELVLPEGHRIGPADLGAAAASGNAELLVRRRPRIAIIPTGTELVAPGPNPKAGDIIEYNSLVLGGQVTEWGGEPVCWPIVPDERTKIRAAVAEALESCDVVVVNAGSSAGSEDFTADILAELGEVAVHGCAIRPGHPVILGAARRKPVLGIPGYPVSALLTAELFLKPLVARLLGTSPVGRPRLAATISRKVHSPLGLDEYLRVKVGRVGDRYVATPLSRGAGVIMSFVRADGVVVIPRFSEGLPAGATVDVELLRPAGAIEHTIVAIGSHDLTLDLLANVLHRDFPPLTLSSSNVGSFGGLTALQRGEAHLAGSHLLDASTGEYNVDYIRRVLPGRAIVLVNLVYRDQGLIVPRGNPKAIGSLEDLTGPDVTFVNRQRGAGTRVLLDYKLDELGIDPDGIRGYEREEYTHLGVAAAVASGLADVGLGILAAARALDLDFVPLLQERYDLLIPAEHYESELLRPLLDTIRGEAFRAAVTALGGYDGRTMGEVVARL